MKKKTIIIIGISVSFLLMPLLIADLIIEPPAVPYDFSGDGVYYHNSGNNSYYTMNQSQHLHMIVLDSGYVQFNETRYNITSIERTNITLIYVSDNHSNTSETAIITSFHIQTVSDLITCNISTDAAVILLINNVYQNGVVPQSEYVVFNLTDPDDDTISLQKAMRSDINLDVSVNYLDTGACALVYGSDPYTGREDVNGDNEVNYLDTGQLGLDYGASY